MLLITLIPQAPWYGGLVLGPDFASDSQYDPSSVCSVRVWLGEVSSELLFSSNTDFRKFEWCLHKEVHGDSFVQ